MFPFSQIVFAKGALLSAFLGLLVFLFFTVLPSITSIKEHNNDIDATLKSTDINDKLNYLIERISTNKLLQKFESGAIYSFVLISLSLLIMFSRRKLFQMAAFFFPFNQFLWGCKKIKYEKRIELRSKLFWRVGIPLLIGVCAGFIVWMLTK